MMILASRTGPHWAVPLVSSMDEVLNDHAHLEKKAASNALQLIFRYPEHSALMTPLSELAREELSHFELVLEHIRVRGGELSRQRPAAYAGRLRSIERSEEPHRLLDGLLTSAIIEARSAERMSALAEALEDEALSKLYRSLLKAEARHQSLFVELAESLFEPAEVQARLREIAEHEAWVLKTAKVEARLHSGEG